ncbi:MAG: carboxypeptidase regulatory-like domain-containing protein [Labilithrix sp.]|nr:carboxypeptidase regulatory-like domain-containing protein [Labilithrix sp.]MCW5815215.1 carboxypeptidase regulatory-like domain-containing protein [Labilithrix sp.]
MSTFLLGVLLLGSGCGSIVDSLFGSDPEPDQGTSSSSGGFGTSSGASGGDGEGGVPCTNLCLRQKVCAGGGTTSLTGVVRDPAGKVPLYNVLVYVPNAPVAPIVDGVSCDRCGSVSGEPLVTALTGVDGRFKLDNVPVGADIPLVVQIGKWRRQLVMQNVPECTSTELDAEAIRMPRNKREGDLPRIALTTGGLDTMECWLKKIGIDESEFTMPSGDGRVSFYAGGQPSGVLASTKRFDQAHGGRDFGKAVDFWSSRERLMQYDMVILSCEGVTDPDNKPPEALVAMHDYANAGGRIFASHWHRFWFDTSRKLPVDEAGPEPAGKIVSPFPELATWADRKKPCNSSDDCVVSGTVDQSFPKGKAMHDWLAQPGVDALTNGQLPIVEARHNVDAVDATKATSWITLPNAREGGKTAVQYLSFNTPIPAPEEEKCGRVVYSGLHVSAGDWSGPDWPSGCHTTDLSPQEKALEFMLFDLSSCIQPDNKAPEPPVVK